MSDNDRFIFQQPLPSDSLTPQEKEALFEHARAKAKELGVTLFDLVTPQPKTAAGNNARLYFEGLSAREQEALRIGITSETLLGDSE